MSNYRVWDPMVEGETTADEFEANDAEDAVVLWAEQADKGGTFADGYPSGDDISARDVATGKLYRVKLHTDFDPIFSTGPAVEVQEPQTQEGPRP